jgi:putative ABC transport system substrate-binding protein
LIYLKKITRRELLPITLLGGVAAAWPVAARAQQPERVRRIGVLTEWDENDPAGRTYLSAFRQGLAELGWIDGRNLKIDYRWVRSRRDSSRASRGRAATPLALVIGNPPWVGNGCNC